jgi:hypothetical protein
MTKYVSLEHAIRNAVRDQQYTKKSVNEDFEFEMARNELRTAIDAAKRLMAQLDGEGDLEAWVQSKITKGADYLDTVADYMDSRDTKKLKEHTKEIAESMTIIGNNAKFQGNEYTTPVHIAPGVTQAAVKSAGHRRVQKQSDSATLQGKVNEAKELEKEDGEDNTILGKTKKFFTAPNPPEDETPEQKKARAENPTLNKVVDWVGDLPNKLPSVGDVRKTVGSTMQAAGLTKDDISDYKPTTPEEIADEQKKQKQFHGAAHALGYIAPLPGAGIIAKGAEKIAAGITSGAKGVVSGVEKGIGAIKPAPKIETPPAATPKPPAPVAKPSEPYNTGVQIKQKEPNPITKEPPPKPANDSGKLPVKPEGIPETLPVKPEGIPSKKGPPEVPPGKGGNPGRTRPGKGGSIAGAAAGAAAALAGALGGDYKTPAGNNEYHDVPVKTSVSQAQAHRKFGSNSVSRFRNFREDTGPDNIRRKDSSKELVGRPDSAGVKDPKSVLARNGSDKTKIIEDKKLAGVVKSVIKKKKEEKESGPNPLVDFEPKLNHKYDNET